MLDIQMRIFKTVVEEMSFSLAAQKLHMTQSSISQHIQNLEAYYGVKLFDRLHRKIAITQAGSILYPYAVELERISYQARNAMESLTKDISGRLHIGTSFTIGEYIMPAILAEFSCMYPQVTLSMEVANTEHIIAMIHEGTINVGFVEGPYESSDILYTQAFSGDQLVLIAPPNFPNENDYSLSALLQKKWVMREKKSGTRRVFEDFLTSQNCDLNSLDIIMELGSTQAVKEGVKAGLGIAAISCLAVENEVAKGDVRIVKLVEGSIERPFTIVMHRERFQPFAAVRFKEFVIEAASNMMQNPSILCKRIIKK